MNANTKEVFSGDRFTRYIIDERYVTTDDETMRSICESTGVEMDKVHATENVGIVHVRHNWAYWEDGMLTWAPYKVMLMEPIKSFDMTKEKLLSRIFNSGTSSIAKVKGGVRVFADAARLEIKDMKEDEVARQGLLCRSGEAVYLRQISMPSEDQVVYEVEGVWWDVGEDADVCECSRFFDDEKDAVAEFERMVKKMRPVQKETSSQVTDVG